MAPLQDLLNDVFLQFLVLHRFMASGKHIGKVLLKIRNEEQDKTPKVVEAIPRTYMDSEKSYVLVGGLGGFGMELCNWLIDRGAKKIVLTSRSGVRNGYQSLSIRRWTEKGVEIVVSTFDASTPKGAEDLLKQATKLGPVDAIFNLAAVCHRLDIPRKIVLNNGKVSELLRFRY